MGPLGLTSSVAPQPKMRAKNMGTKKSPKTMIVGALGQVSVS